MWHWWNDDRLVWALWPGVTALLLAVLAWLADRRRHRRVDLDAVGFIPWTSVFVLALLIAVVLLGLAARIWLTA